MGPGESTVTAGLETPPINGTPASAPPYEVQRFRIVPQLGLQVRRASHNRDHFQPLDLCDFTR